MTLGLLFVGLFVVWFTFHAVADHIDAQKIKRLVAASDDRGAENLRRNRR